MNGSRGPFTLLAKMARKPVKSSQYNEQLQSSFFSKLPLDVRNGIFKQLVADLGDVLHITTSYKLQGKERKQIY
jgi:hypothetical protein